MGMRSPIFNEAFSLSMARISGRCSTFELLSDARAVKLAPGTDTEISPAVIPEKEFRLSPEDPEEEPDEEEPVEPEAPPGANATLTVVGGAVPRVWILPRLTSITTTSITTSDFGLSISPSSFWAITIWSGVPRRVSDRNSGVT